MNAEDLGPLFTRPEDPHYLWVLGVIVVAGCVFAACIGLVRGKASLAGAAVGLIAFPVFSFVLGYLFMLEESKRLEFCGSCHETMSPITTAIQTDTESLSGIHWSKGAVEHTEACYQCHSGYGIWGATQAKRAGISHMIHTITGNYEFPIKKRGTFDVNACLGCHAEAEPFRVVEDHQDREMQEALLTGEIGCTGDCHPAAHPESALNGVGSASVGAAGR
jgi:nitrate/TMAO reductase-like tetraheme cytochrome c subunit